MILPVMIYKAVEVISIFWRGWNIEGILKGPRGPKKGQVYLSDLLPLDLDRSGRVETGIALGSDLDCKAFQVTQFAGLSADMH